MWWNVSVSQTATLAVRWWDCCNGVRLIVILDFVTSSESACSVEVIINLLPRELWIFKYRRCIQKRTKRQNCSIIEPYYEEVMNSRDSMIATLKCERIKKVSFRGAASHFHSLSLATSIKHRESGQYHAFFTCCYSPRAHCYTTGTFHITFSCTFCQTMLDGSSQQPVLWQHSFNFNLVLVWLQLSLHRVMFVFRILMVCLNSLTRPFSSLFSLHHWTPFFRRLHPTHSTSGFCSTAYVSGYLFWLEIDANRKHLLQD